VSEGHQLVFADELEALLETVSLQAAGGKRIEDTTMDKIKIAANKMDQQYRYAVENVEQPLLVIEYIVLHAVAVLTADEEIANGVLAEETATLIKRMKQILPNTMQPRDSLITVRGELCLQHMVDIAKSFDEYKNQVSEGAAVTSRDRYAKEVENSVARSKKSESFTDPGFV
jgi:predicted metal-dependent hydrolase